MGRVLLIWGLCSVGPQTNLCTVAPEFVYGNTLVTTLGHCTRYIQQSGYGVYKSNCLFLFLWSAANKTRLLLIWQGEGHTKDFSFLVLPVAAITQQFSFCKTVYFSSAEYFLSSVKWWRRDEFLSLLGVLYLFALFNSISLLVFPWRATFLNHASRSFSLPRSASKVLSSFSTSHQPNSLSPARLRSDSLFSRSQLSLFKTISQNFLESPSIKRHVYLFYSPFQNPCPRAILNQAHLWSLLFFLLAPYCLNFKCFFHHRVESHPSFLRSTGEFKSRLGLPAFSAVTVYSAKADGLDSAPEFCYSWSFQLPWNLHGFC